MPFEEEISKKLAKAPDVLIALFWALVLTGAAFLFVYFAKVMHVLPGAFDLPWIIVFVVVFFMILVRKRIKLMRSDSKPSLP